VGNVVMRVVVVGLEVVRLAACGYVTFRCLTCSRRSCSCGTRVVGLACEEIIVIHL